MDRQFDASYIDHELNNIGSRIQRQVSIYLIGGCAMSFRNLKETTKDIDIVFLRMKQIMTHFAGLYLVRNTTSQEQ